MELSNKVLVVSAKKILPLASNSRPWGLARRAAVAGPPSPVTPGRPVPAMVRMMPLPMAPQLVAAPLRADWLTDWGL